MVQVCILAGSPARLLPPALAPPLTFQGNGSRCDGTHGRRAAFWPAQPFLAIALSLKFPQAKMPILQPSTWFLWWCSARQCSIVLWRSRNEMISWGSFLELRLNQCSETREQVQLLIDVPLCRVNNRKIPNLSRCCRQNLGYHANTRISSPSSH